MNQPGISVVIPAYNEEKFLPATIAAVRAAQIEMSKSSQCPVEIIVVNNASTDQTADVAAELGAKVVHHYIRNISSVRNAGIYQAQYDLVVTIDADSHLSKNAFNEILRVMKDGKTIGGAFRVKVITHRLEMKIVAFIIQRVVRWVSGISGAMFFFSREAALKVGGFSEVHLVAEDSTFALSLQALAKKEQKRFIYLRSATVGTLDRKEMNLGTIVPAIFQGLRGFLGYKQNLEDLKYWYQPKR